MRFYVEQAELIKQYEKTTMQVDFSHLANFRFNEPYLIDQILQQYVRFEPYLR
ncbi:MAG: hypothetical protein ACK521_02050 [bacterium]